jgi:two-component system, LytTR family, sensor kinase
MELQKNRVFVRFEYIIMLLVLPIAAGAMVLWLYLSGINTSRVAGNYLYSILIAFGVWCGCRIAYFKTRHPLRLHHRYGHFVGKYLLACVLISWSLAFTGLRCFFDQYLQSRQMLLIATCISTLALLISIFYELIFLYNEDRAIRIENARLKKDNQINRIGSLTARVEPHFLFNCLNTLQNLIAKDQQSADRFNRVLSELYRDIVEMNKHTLISLRQEIDIMYKYYHLVSVRFPGAVQLRITMNDFDIDRLMIVPLSLQLLFENAVKHSFFSPENPLYIDIHITNTFVLFQNEAIPARRMTSPGNGLAILAGRYSLHKKQIEIDHTGNIFKVKLPLKKQTHAHPDNRR